MDLGRIIACMSKYLTHMHLVRRGLFTFERDSAVFKGY